MLQKQKVQGFKRRRNISKYKRKDTADVPTTAPKFRNYNSFPSAKFLINDVMQATYGPVMKLKSPELTGKVETVFIFFLFFS